MIRSYGHEAYDFKNPRPGDNGFHWSAVGEGWQAWNVKQYRKALQHPIAEAGFKSDFDAMQWADACVLVLPCGRSAHLEAGWFAGKGKLAVAYIEEVEQPDLMYKVFGGTPIVSTPAELSDLIDRWAAQ